MDLRQNANALTLYAFAYMHNMPHIIHYHQEWSPHRHLVRIFAFVSFCVRLNHMASNLTLFGGYVFVYVKYKCRNISFHCPQSTRPTCTYIGILSPNIVLAVHRASSDRETGSNKFLPQYQFSFNEDILQCTHSCQKFTCNKFLLHDIKIYIFYMHFYICANPSEIFPSNTVGIYVNWLW